MTDQDLIHQLRNSKGWPTLGNLAADRIEALIAERDALTDALVDAEAERHRWRQAAAKGSLHTQADLDRAVAEARAVALEEAGAEQDRLVAAFRVNMMRYQPGYTHADFDALIALIDTPAAEALERVQTEERAKGMERAGTILLDNPHSTRWHVLEVIRAEAAAIRARGET